MKNIILGGGLAGLSLAHFLKQESIILEYENSPGGLLRSFNFHKIKCDIGPHILFSKNKKALNFLTSLTKTNLLRRSNKIFHEGKLVKYPFENELSALSYPQRDYCLKEFLNNPYRNYEAKNMLQFFLKTFGEGITKLYLQPYNEKIWKFDPALIDIQMAGRIPRPPDEDIIKSAKGISTEGYTHQLYFHYPKKEGINELVYGLEKLLENKCRIVCKARIKKIAKTASGWRVETQKEIFSAKRLINCMPLHELFNYIFCPPDIKKALDELKYNSIHILLLKVTKDNLGNNFAVNFADKNIIFHRLSKPGFLGENYRFHDKSSVLMAEITFRPQSYLSKLNKKEIFSQVKDGLEKTKIVKKSDITSYDLKTFKYAYVIYDINHRKNADKVLKYLSKLKIFCCGRFAEFEYLNMDAVVSRSMKLASLINKI